MRGDIQTYRYTSGCQLRLFLDAQVKGHRVYFIFVRAEDNHMFTDVTYEGVWW